MAKYEELCKAILENVGGRENIKNAVHCMTRLRIGYVDESKIDVEAIKATKGVLGAQFSGGQFQIIIGQTVSDVYKEFCEMANLQQSAAIDENLDAAPLSIKDIPGVIMDYVSGAIAPIIPIFVVAGFFKLVYSLCGPQLLNLAAPESQFMVSFNLVGNACLYFMPVFAGYSAAKKLNTDEVMGLLIGALLVAPDFVSIVTTGEPFKAYGAFPMPLNNYAQSILPILLSVWVLKYVHGFIDKHCPTSIKVLGVPFGTMLVMFPLVFCLLAPVGNWLSLGIAALIEGLYNVAGPFAIMIIGAFWMLLVSTGMHAALRPIALLNFSTLGCDPIILAGSNVANYALMGMIVAYALRTKGEEKELAFANAITLIVGGISEPTLFSVFLRNRRAMICQMIGGAVGGLIGGFLGIKVYTLGASNFLCVLSYAGEGNNLLYACVACGIGFVVSLVVGLIFGFGTAGEKAGRKLGK